MLGAGVIATAGIWGVSGLVAFALLGAYMFVVNQVSFGHPMGPETAVEAQTGGQTSQSWWRTLCLIHFAWHTS